jgi:hypothetical protein
MGAVNYLAELERMGLPVVPTDEDWVKTLCPFHEDKDPSCGLNVRNGGFRCYVCEAHGDFIKFMARHGNSTRAAARELLNRQYGLDEDRVIEARVVERMHEALWQAKHLLKELYDRGLTDDDVRKYRLGFIDGRVAIPVKNDHGSYVNIRKYMPGAPGADKFRNSRGRGKMRLYPVEQLKYKQVLLTGGECKAIVGARILNDHDVGCICASGGETNWLHEFTLRFRGVEKVWIGLDIDEAGRKAAELRAGQIATVVPWVGIVHFPLDPDKYPKGDLNDFVGRENGDLWTLLQQTSQWTPPSRVADPNEEPCRVKFNETVLSHNVGKRMRFTAVVAAASERSFVVPKRVIVTCDKAQDCCGICLVHPEKNNVFHISPESPAILEMVGSSKDGLEKATRAALGVPKQCKVVQFDVRDHFNVEDVRFNPSLEITNRDSDKTLQQALCVQCDATLNSTYEFVGRMYPDPRSQRASLVVAQSAATHDALERHEPKELHRLRMFRPAQWTLESLTQRLGDLYEDLEANVTRIYMRRDMHLFIDLVYHSVLLLKVDGKTTKGWTDILIMGDSSQGKSEAYQTLQEHYRLGEKFDCKNASAAGVLGGLTQLSETWYVSWGVVPTNDKRAVCLEEAKGLWRHQVIPQMTDMRSSGRAELTKISKRRTFARTRLLWLSNAMNDRTMATYNFGIEAISDLVGAPEDVRRFDAALIVASSEVDAGEINRLVRDPPQVKHRHTGDLCNALILWAWTRKEDDVVIDDDASALISEAASAMAKDYSDQIPLVDKGSMRQKLSRLSAALACRTFSTGETELQVRVRACHAEYIRELLTRIYESKTFGYRFYSEAQQKAAVLVDPGQIAERMRAVLHTEEFRESLLYSDQLDLIDVQNWSGWDRIAAQDFISLLVRKRAIKRMGPKYVKTPEFIGWLKGQKFENPPPHLMKEKF